MKRVNFLGQGGPGRTERGGRKVTPVELIDRAIERDVYGCAQLYLSKAGRAVLSAARGTTAQSPLSTGHAMPWRCATKPVVAATCWELAEEGRLRLDSPMADYYPRFGDNGKGKVTVRHVLDQRVGFQDDPPAEAVLPRTREEVVQLTSRARLRDSAALGRTWSYSEWIGWSALGEVLKGATGFHAEPVIRSTVVDRLGLQHCWVGMSESDYGANAERLVVSRGRSAFERVCLVADGPTMCGRSSLAKGGRGPAEELGRFYEALLGYGMGGGCYLRLGSTVAEELKGASGSPIVMGPRTVPPGRWCLGFQRNPQRFGRYCSEGSFGQGGNSGVAFADPKEGIVVVFLFDAVLGWVHAMAEWQQVVEASYRLLA